MARVKYTTYCVSCGRVTSTTLPKMLGRFRCKACRKKYFEKYFESK